MCWEMVDIDQEKSGDIMSEFQRLSCPAVSTAEERRKGEAGDWDDDDVEDDDEAGGLSVPAGGGGLLQEDDDDDKSVE